MAFCPHARPKCAILLVADALQSNSQGSWRQRRICPVTSPHSRLAAARESESSLPQHAPAPDAATQTALPSPTAATIPSLVTHSAMRGRGNGTVRATAIQQMQRTSGNRAVQRLLAGRTAAGAPPINSRSGGVSIQRNGTGLAGAGAVGQFTANIK